MLETMAAIVLRSRALRIAALGCAVAGGVWGQEPKLTAIRLDRSDVVGGVVSSVGGTVYLETPTRAQLEIPLTQTPSFETRPNGNCFDADGAQQDRHPVAAKAPSVVRVAAGQREGRFRIETYLVEDTPKQMISFTATAGGVTQSAALTLRQWRISSFNVVRNPTSSSAAYTAYLALDGPAPFDLMVFIERPDGGRLRNPDGSLIAQRLSRGSSSVSIAANLTPLCGDGSTTARVVANPGCLAVLGRAETGVQCEPPPGLSYLSINPQVVVGGATAQGEVGLFGTTPVPVQVALTTDCNFIKIPAFVTVQSGQSKAVFQIQTSDLPPGSSQVQAVVRAEYRTHESNVLWIRPPG